jgi:hypothetical protein
MRIDAQHRGYLTGDNPPIPVGPGLPPEYDPRLPEVAPDIQILVNDDFVEDLSVRGPGMLPFFGLDGIDQLPALEYGLDGPAEAQPPFDPIGPEIDGVNAPGQAFSRVLIAGPMDLDFDAILAPPRRRPIPSPESVNPDDAMEPRVRSAGMAPPAGQLEEDGLPVAAAGFDVRAPIVGADGFEPVVLFSRPAVDPQFVNLGDGVDLVGGNRLRLAS